MSTIVFILFACTMAFVVQVVTLPLAPLIGLRRQWALACWSGVGLAVYIAFWS